MEGILSHISEVELDVEHRRRAFELILKAVRNILQAENSKSPDSVKYRWIKCQEGSSFHAKVLSLHPLFRRLCEALGFRFLFARPPYLSEGELQDYMFLEDGFSLGDLEANAAVLEAVVHSLAEGHQSKHLSGARSSVKEMRRVAERSHRAASTETSQVRNPQQTTLPQPASRVANGSRPAPAGESTLEDIRREQQQRYRERQSRGFPGSASGTGSVSGQRNDAENDGTNWFWKFWGWGGGTGRNDNDGRGGGNGGSRPRSSRVMTLRDLPQPKRSG